MGPPMAVLPSTVVGSRYPSPFLGSGIVLRCRVTHRISETVVVVSPGPRIFEDIVRLKKNKNKTKERRRPPARTPARFEGQVGTAREVFPGTRGTPHFSWRKKVDPHVRNDKTQYSGTAPASIETYGLNQQSRTMDTDHARSALRQSTLNAGEASLQYRISRPEFARDETNARAETRNRVQSNAIV